MNRESIATDWLHAHITKLIDMSDLQIAQFARERYIKKGNGFHLSTDTVANLLGIQDKNAVRRLRRLTESGLWTRKRFPQGDANQYKGYVYFLAGVDA